MNDDGIEIAHIGEIAVHNPAGEYVAIAHRCSQDNSDLAGHRV